MSGEKVVEEIVRDPRLLSLLTDKIYERLKDEILIKKLDEYTKAILSLQEAVRRQGEAIQSLQEVVKEHSSAIRSLQEEVKRQGEAIQGLQDAVKKHSEAIQSLQEVVKRHSDAILSLQEAVRDHSKVILRLVKEQKRLSIEIGSFTSRAGRGIERSMLKLYKKALELHGVDPKRVKHGVIVDTIGVIEKGRSFEVDFYETNDYIYVFEIKNFADEGVIDQVIIRKKLFSALYNKPLKFFVVANYIEKAVKEKLEKEDVEIISSFVVE
ncbi:MAG: hypothetical protein QXO96_01925 [Sulfolobales archaeon]